MNSTVPASCGELSIPPDPMSEIMERLMQIDILLRIADDISDIRAPSRMLLSEAALLVAQAWIPVTDLPTIRVGRVNGQNTPSEGRA